jgi:hypothetical protein
VSKLSSFVPWLPLFTGHPRIYATDKKIRDFAKLQEGWRFHEGIPFDRAVLEDARELNHEAGQLGLCKTDAFPATDGSVVVTISFNKHYVEFTVEPNNLVTLNDEYDDDEMSEEEGLTLQEAKMKMRELGQRWLGYESFAGATITETKNDLLHLPLGRPAPEGFQSSARSVYSYREGRFATTSENIILHPSLTSHQSSGYSQKKFYQRGIA